MKKIFTVVFAACLFLISHAQIKVSDKAVISLPTLQNCDQCKEQIEFFIGKTDGVTAVRVNLRAKTINVSWLTDRTNKEYIKSAISALGYTADDIEADDFAVKRLPLCCRKPLEKPKTATKPKG